MKRPITKKGAIADEEAPVQYMMEFYRISRNTRMLIAGLTATSIGHSAARLTKVYLRIKLWPFIETALNNATT